MIDRSQDLREQIIWADYVIHDGCTTAIEAKYLGKKVLGLRPSLSPPFYDNFANQFSENYDTAESIINAIGHSKFDASSVN